MASETKPNRGLNRRELLSLSAMALCARGSFAQSTPSGPELRLPLLEQPAHVWAWIGDVEPQALMLERLSDNWTGGSGSGAVEVSLRRTGNRVAVTLAARGIPVQRLHLRWSVRLGEELSALGDAWERSYGELQWLPLQAERALPWYALLHRGDQTVGMGVETGAASFAFWQVDRDGISLWLDVRNGGSGVSLGQRVLEAATITMYTGEKDESAFSVASTLCRLLAHGTTLARRRGSLPTQPIYGSNDWYYAYGQNTAEGILRDADLMAALAPQGAARPFVVVDDGYQDPHRFPSMTRLAEGIRSRQVTPGVWIRPLRAARGTAESLLLPAARWNRTDGVDEAPAYDPTIPEAREKACAVAQEARLWGFELIKHDFTTYELFGRWGDAMGPSPTGGNWHFNDASRTNAEIVRTFYADLRAACGDDRIVLGCNTVGHLAVGLFDAQRTGDDVSGKVWDRTRRTGVNTLAFRLPQHNVFFALDADCVPVTSMIPWEKTQQWLEAVVRSGTVLLVSPEPSATGPAQKAAIREAFAQLIRGSESEPTDWLVSRTPTQWRSGSSQREYDWLEIGGASPFRT